MSYQVIEKDSNEQALVTFNEWSLPVSTLTADIPSRLSTVRFQTIKYSNNSLYVWIGDSNSKLENISCAMKVRSHFYET